MSLDARYDFVLFFDVENGNPNGDPDAGNMPRLDPETMQGLVSDGALKRKVRDYLLQRYPNAPGMDIFVKHGGVLNNEIAKAYENTGVVKAEGGKGGPTRAQREEARAFMCRTFYDVRAFGAVMSTGLNAGQVRGPVQLTFARSVEPIAPLEIAITRVAFTDQKKADEKQNSTEMGRKHIVPYACYRAHGFVSASLARQTGFDEQDLKKLWEALQMMFEGDRSAARGFMSTRRLLVFQHAGVLGNAPAHRLFDAVQVTRKSASGSLIPPAEAERPACSYADYHIEVDPARLPPDILLLDDPGIMQAGAATNGTLRT